ncbi:MAG: aldo/keto reductase [Clostridia bacterium]|nr:aldo/keto reductase [Clostridia bacterium]
MTYREDKYGNKLSVLGYGCMRFPRNVGLTDFKNTEKQIKLAIEKGINYFDTAYIYPESEATLGKILEKNNLRDKVYIATKLPHYLIKSREGLNKIFEEELSRLKTRKIDYYLMHMLTDTDTWSRLKDLGIEDWISEKKAEGKIGQIGFSYHGNSDMFCKLVDTFDWDFCMIQYNYMDEHTQAGRRGLNHAHKKGIPVMIMEPLRGGKLVKGLPEKAKAEFKNHTVKRTPAEWSFAWLYDQPEVSVVLSGMNSEEMILENVKTAETCGIGDLTEQDREMLSRVVKEINSKIKVGCTGCGYCMPCPKGVDIPGSFAAYNRYYSDSKFEGLKDYFMCTALRKNSTAVSNCINCGKCESHCPQAIEIRKELKNVQAKLEVPIYKVASKLAKKFVKF